MMFHRLGLINKNQRGFALIGLIVAIAISGLISAGIAVAIFQVFSYSNQGAAYMTAVKQVENAVYWITRDAQMAQIVEPDGDSGFPLNLTWVEWDNTVHQVTYILEDSELQRDHSINYGEPSKIVVARYIHPGLEVTNCEFIGGVLTLEVTATVGEGSQLASETRVCEVIPRSGS